MSRVGLRRSTRSSRSRRHITTRSTPARRRGSGVGAAGRTPLDHVPAQQRRFKVHKWRQEWVTEGHLELKKFVKTDEVAARAARPPGFKRRKRPRNATVKDLGIAHRAKLTPALVAYMSGEDVQTLAGAEESSQLATPKPVAAAAAAAAAAGEASPAVSATTSTTPSTAAITTPAPPASKLSRFASPTPVPNSASSVKADDTHASSDAAPTPTRKASD